MKRPEDKRVSNPIHRSVEDGTFRPQTVEPKTKPKPKSRRQQDKRDIRDALED